LAVLKRAFYLAAESDPPRVNRVPHFPMLQESNVREGFLEHESYMKLRDVLPDGVQLLIVVAYHVGCRSGELLKVKWSQVDLVAHRIQLAPSTTKNKQARTLPIYGEMIERLRLEKQIRGYQISRLPSRVPPSGKAGSQFQESLGCCP
jgi:integrase